MNNIFGILISLVPVIAFCQGKQAHPYKPPKKANVVIIESTQKRAKELLISYATALQEKGYFIEKLDTSTNQLSTDWKLYKFTGIAEMKIKVVAFQKEDIANLVIRGSIQVTNALVAEKIPYPACNCYTFKGDARELAFKEILLSLSGFKYDTIEIKEE